MKILLVSPPTDAVETIPLGLAYIGAVLKQEGYEVHAMDGAAPYANLTSAKIIKKAEELSPDVIGVSMNLYHIKEAYKIASQLSRLGKPLIAGGPYPTIRPEEVLNNHFDIVVKGEGENTILELLDYFKGNKALKDILGISYRDNNGHIIHHPWSPFINDLDTLPFPARELFPMRDYTTEESLNNSMFWTTLVTSRGCPGVCTYCVATSALGKKFRFRSAKSVYDEIKELNKRYGIRIFRFVDDAFTFDKERLFELCDLVINDSDLKDIIWDCDSRIVDVTEEMLIKMKEAHCVSIIYGIESGDPETLKRIRKGVTLKKIKDVVDMTAKVNIPKVKINIMIGFPWENKSHINNSINLLKECNKKMEVIFGTTPIIPYPGSLLYETYHKEHGFTDWWLKNDAFPEVVGLDGRIPFYKRYILYIDNFALNKNFFKYNRSLKRYIEKAIVNTGKMVMRKTHGFLYAELLYTLAYFSLFLFRINPRLEYAIFSLLNHSSLKKTIKKLAMFGVLK